MSDGQMQSPKSSSADLDSPHLGSNKYFSHRAMDIADEDFTLPGNTRSVGTQHDNIITKTARDLNWHGRKLIDPNHMLVPKKPEVGSDDIDRFNHDIFNLFALPFLALSAYVALNEISEWEEEFQTGFDWSRGEHPSPPSYYWHIACITFVIYMICDATWITFRPRAVRSTPIIYIHHSVVCFGYFVSYKYLEHPLHSRYRVAILTASLVEINTWFLTARRTFTVLRTVVSLGFYFTWVYFRLWMTGKASVMNLIWASEVLFHALDLDNNGVVSEAEWGSASIFVKPIYVYYAYYAVWVSTIMMGLNMKWTWDLIMSKLKAKKPGKKVEKCL